jgi:hypothetical protein
MAEFGRSVSLALIASGALLAVQLGFAPAAQAGIFKKIGQAMHKVGEEAHDAGTSLGKEVSKTGDTATHEIVKDGKVVGHAVVKGGRIVEEKTVQGGKVVATEAVKGGQLIVKDGKIVGRDVVVDGKVVGTEVIKDGKVVGHTVVAGGEYIVKDGQIMLSPPVPVAMPGDFPPPAAAKTSALRLAECQAAKTPNCYATHQMQKKLDIPSNCLYGWNVGAGHPSSNDNPPNYDKLLNAIDQCAWFHDRGAWRYNEVTHVCEAWEMCSNSMGLRRCLDRYQPKNPAEAQAKACFSNFFEKAMQSCIPALYKDWGAEMSTDPKGGEQWLSAKSISQLRGAMKKCPRPMHRPGFSGL